MCGTPVEETSPGPERWSDVEESVLVIYFGSAASWRPCNVVWPHQGPVSHSRRLYGRPSAQCNKVALGTTREVLWCHVSDGSVFVGWLGRGNTTSHLLHHTSHTAPAHLLFPSLPGPVVGEMLSAARFAAVGMVGRPLTHVVRDAFL